MTAADSGFYGRIALLFGPLFIAGGWLASFTDAGAFLIYAGFAMLVASPVLLVASRSHK